MVRNHLKRLVMPVTWTTKLKKGVKWVSTVNPGAHNENEGMPLVLALREILTYAKTTREVKHILNNKEVLVDGVVRKDHRFNVGLMDVISIPGLKDYYRVSMNKNNRLSLVKIDEKEASTKVCTIRGKGLYKGKTQLRLSDGRVILADKGKYKTSDAVVISLPDQKIHSHIAFEKGATVLLVGGKKAGIIGTIDEIKKDTVTIKADKHTLETAKRYCFVVGKTKSEVTIE